MSIGASLADRTAAVRLALLGPDGPTEFQITVAVSSKDSFATDQNGKFSPSTYLLVHTPKDGLSFRPT